MVMTTKLIDDNTSPGTLVQVSWKRMCIIHNCILYKLIASKSSQENW